MIRQVLLLTLGISFGVAHSGFAQKKMGRYHKNLLYEADLYYAQGDYYYASELYTQLCAVAPDNGEILGKIGICYYNLPPFKDQAQRFLQMSVKASDVEAHYYLAKMHMENYMFYDALSLIEIYEKKAARMKSVSEIEHLKASIQRAAAYVQAPLPVTIRNLGPGVNTPHHDYAPVWDSLHERIFFTSRRRMDDKSEKDFSEQFDENIYIIDLKSESLTATPAGMPLNSRTNDAAVACAPDGRSLIIFRTSRDGYSGDLLITQKSGTQWGDLEKLNDRINSKAHEASASFGDLEGNILYFSSDRPGGYGGKDIYSVQKLPDGSWGQPQNLGEKINTNFDEDAPFMAAGGSLYFASKGHSAMGGYDIFCSKFISDAWMTPGNLGYPINTPGDDIFFVIDASGSKAYFSSERMGGMGLQDLYEVSFNAGNSVIVKGALLTDDDQIPADATVKLIDEDLNRVEGIFQTDPKGGTFVIALNTNKNYLVRVEADGFVPLEKSLFFKAVEGSEPREVNEKLILSK